jgi:hypothetical protein
MKSANLLAATLLFLLSSLGFSEPRPPEVEILDRYLGVWDDTTDPNGTIVTHCEWILDGSFLRHTWTLENADGSSVEIGVSLMSYDRVEKSYRGWTFFSNGVAENGTAIWDEASKTFTWTVHSPVTDLTTTTRVAFPAPGQEITEFTTTDGAGKVVDKNRRKKVRRLDSEPSRKTAGTGSR